MGIAGDNLTKLHAFKCIRCKKVSKIYRLLAICAVVPDGKIELRGTKVRDNRQCQIEQLRPDRAHGERKEPSFPVSSQWVVRIESQQRPH